MNLNDVVEEMGRLLPRLIGEDIELVIRSSEDLGAIRADASQMEQVIMNLAVTPGRHAGRRAAPYRDFECGTGRHIQRCASHCPGGPLRSSGGLRIPVRHECGNAGTHL